MRRRRGGTRAAAAGPGGAERIAVAQQAFASGMDLILLVGGLVVLMGVLAAATLVRGRELAPRPEPRRIEPEAAAEPAGSG